MEPFEERTGIDVVYVGTADFASAMVERTRDGSVPDIALFPQPGLMAELAGLDIVLPLPDDIVADAQDEYRPEAVDLGRVDGVVYGLPYRLNAKSLIWHDPREFADRGYPIPSTWPELRQLTDTMVADGIAPWCIGVEALGADGWVGTDWVEDIMLRLYGVDEYDSWVKGETSFVSEPLAAAFSEFSDLALDAGRPFGGRRAVLTTSVSEAMTPMFADPPGCMMHRQASFYADSLPPDTTIGPDGDVDIFVMPGIENDEPPLLVGGDVAAAFADRPEVWALMDYLASPESGEAWAQEGNYVSPHARFDSEIYTLGFDRRVDALIDETETVRFDASDRMPTAVGSGSFLEAMLELIIHGDVGVALETAQAGYG